MANTETFQLVKDNRHAITEALQNELKALMQEEADAIASDAKGRVPSTKIQIRVQPDGKNGFKVSAGSRRIFWAGFMEWGTIRQVARPFMTPASESGFSRMKSKLEVIANKIERMP